MAALTFAWRCWALSAADPGLLCSALDPHPGIITWAAGSQPARCAFHDHPAPDPGCRCGWRGQPDLDDLLWWLQDWKRVTPHVVGGVHLSGRIIQGDHAHPEIPRILRAQTAQVCGPLLVGPVTRQAASVVLLARRYGVAVKPSSEGRASRWLDAAADDLLGVAEPVTTRPP